MDPVTLIIAAAVVLLFLLLAQTTGAVWPSAFAAAIWAIHPLRIESVAWVAERKDVLSTFLFIATIFVYVRGRRMAAEDRGPERRPAHRLHPARHPDADRVGRDQQQRLERRGRGPRVRHRNDGASSRELP